MDICPVGALTSKDFRFQMRVWFLKETKSVCTSCATGCNIIIGSREEKVYRYEPRENDAVNSCVDVRSRPAELQMDSDRADRLKDVLVRGQKSTLDDRTRRNRGETQASSGRLQWPSSPRRDRQTKNSGC